MSRGYATPLQVCRFIATRSGDTERGPMIWINDEEARKRLLLEGELAWVYGPRRHEFATVAIDDTVERGNVVVRDIAGVTLAAMVRVVKLDLDRADFPAPEFRVRSLV